MGWKTPDVANVPSPVRRLSAPPDLGELVDEWADGVQIPREDAIEVLVRSRLATSEDSPAAVLWRGYQQRRTQTPAQVREALADVAELVVGVRMGPRRPDTAKNLPWVRSTIGVDLDADSVHAWPQIRGLWRMKMRPSLFVGIRLGWAGWMYRVDSWQVHEPTGRAYADAAVAITPAGRRIDALSGADRGPASSLERHVFEVLRSAPILTPRSSAGGGSPNPVVRLTG